MVQGAFNETLRKVFKIAPNLKSYSREGDVDGGYFEVVHLGHGPIDDVFIVVAEKSVIRVRLAPFGR